MNALEEHIQKNHLNEGNVMNWLQDRGWISDNAVHAKDVAEREAEVTVARMLALKKAREA